MPVEDRRLGAPVAHLFVYGSLVDPRCLDEVLGHRFAGERLRARLDGFERVLTDRYAYPFLVVQPAHSVDGILVMDLSPAQFDVLDQYEDVGAGVYERIAVEVEAWSCGPQPIYLAAQTYVAGAQLRSTVS
jgi:gamma-glutamylcyclotransferase (GGCT)/AIG2-like uncharacterized protein YtfP